MEYADGGDGSNELPWNLPEIISPIGAYTYSRQLANTLLIGLSTNLQVGDPNLYNIPTGRALRVDHGPSPRATLSHDRAMQLVEDSEERLLASNDTALTCGGATYPDACYFEGLGCRPSPPDVSLDPSSLRRAQFTWMTTIAGANNAFGLIALPYLPFFSNCEGFDSNVYIGKLTGTIQWRLFVCGFHYVFFPVQRTLPLAVTRTCHPPCLCPNTLGMIRWVVVFACRC